MPYTNTTGHQLDQNNLSFFLLYFPSTNLYIRLIFSMCENVCSVICYQKVEFVGKKPLLDPFASESMIRYIEIYCHMQGSVWAVQNLFWAGLCPKLGLNPPFTAQNCPKLPKTVRNCQLIMKVPNWYLDSYQICCWNFLMLKAFTSDVFIV